MERARTPRTLGDRRPLDLMDAAPPLTVRDEHGLEAIRRQLDVEFAHAAAPEDVAATRAAEPPGGPRRGRVPWSRTVAGVLLLACAAGSAAGALVTLLFVKADVPAPRASRPAPPAAVERPEPPATTSTRRPREGTAGPRGPVAPPASVPAPQRATPVVTAPAAERHPRAPVVPPPAARPAPAPAPPAPAAHETPRPESVIPQAP